MEALRFKPGDCWRIKRFGRRPPVTVIFVLLAGMLSITMLTAKAASTDNHMTLMEKGTKTMEQAATVPPKNLPPLDVSLPSRVETFTFGLG